MPDKLNLSRKQREALRGEITKKLEAQVPVKDIAAEYGIAIPTLYGWLRRWRLWRREPQVDPEPRKSVEGANWPDLGKRIEAAAVLKAAGWSTEDVVKLLFPY